MEGWYLAAMDWIIFDVMGVLFKEGDDTGNLLLPFVQSLVSGVSATAVVRYYRLASLGAIQPKEFWARLGLGYLYPFHSSNLCANF